MRTLLAFMLLASVAGIAHADDDGSGPQPMTALADPGDACKTLGAGDAQPAKATCKVLAHVKLKDGTAELIQGDGDVIRYAIVLTTGGTASLSPAIEITPADCAMHHCAMLGKHTPRLRAIDGGAHAALDLSAAYHSITTDPDTGKQRDENIRWSTYDATVCGTGKGGLVCLTKHWGDRGGACTGSIAADGTITTSCTATTSLDL